MAIDQSVWWKSIFQPFLHSFSQLFIPPEISQIEATEWQNERKTVEFLFNRYCSTFLFHQWNYVLPSEGQRKNNNYISTPAFNVLQVHIAHAHVIPTDTALGHRYHELCGGKRITNRFQPSCLLDNLHNFPGTITTHISFVQNWITNESNRWSIEWHWKLKTRFAFVPATCYQSFVWSPVITNSYSLAATQAY